MNRLLKTLILSSILAPIHTASQAQTADDYPSRPIRIVVPWAPGGPTDSAARAVSLGIAEVTGRSAVVDSQPGAAGIIGGNLVVNSKPDGYTLLLCGAGTLAFLPYLRSDLPFVPLRDLQPVSSVGYYPYYLLVNPKSPFHSVKDLVDYAKANPGKLNYGSAGAGSLSNLVGELFKSSTGIEMTHVPYKGSLPASTDLMAGVLDALFDAAPSALPQIAAGRVRAIAIADKDRLPLTPDVPTFDEAGVPGFQASTWLGICAPAATPRDIVVKLNGIINKGINGERGKKLVEAAGGTITTGTPEKFRDFIVSEQKKWKAIIEQSGMKVTN